MQPHNLKPLQKLAIATLGAVDNARRCRGGYAPEGNPESPLLISIRTANGLIREGLVVGEPSEFPERIALTERGHGLAAQIANCDDLRGAA